MKLRTQMTWCRRGFVLLCALPTLFVVGWISSRGILGDRSLQKEDWERELTAQLGMKFDIGSVSHPSPAIVELKNVEVREAETGRLVARAAAIQLSRSQDGYVIELIAPEGEAEQLAAGTPKTPRRSYVPTRLAPSASGPLNVLRQR